MGMFDELACMYPLPIRDGYERTFQTKSLNCLMDEYLIKDDGSLWVEEYDVEDRSDPTATGLMALAGMMTRVNKRLVPCEFTGEVRFYDGGDGPWYEFSAYFVKGQLKHLETIENPEIGSGNQDSPTNSAPTSRSAAQK